MVKKISSALLITFILFAMGPVLNLQAATETSGAGIVSVSSGSLNVRASASSNGAILTTLSKGSYVTLISRSGDWWKVEYAAGKYGYVSSSLITQFVGEITATVNITSGYVNVRSGASSSYPVISTLYDGQVVIVLAESYGWSKILYNGTKIGYASSQFMKSSNKMTWPVPASSRITQYFSSTHLGMDIGASTPGVTGDKVVSASNGTVVYSGWLNGYGYVAYINTYYNGQYVQLRYGHMKSAPYVSAGSTVSAGQTIGAMGNTGTSTSAHLHFEVRVRHASSDCIANADSTAVNPINYVSY